MLLDPGFTFHRNPFLEALSAGGYPNAGWRDGRRLYDNLPIGCIIATCDLTGCWKIETPLNRFDISDQERAFGDYTPNRYMWILDDIERILPPIPAKGNRRLWDWEEEYETE